jgi:hypothetical protein
VKACARAERESQDRQNKYFHQTVQKLIIALSGPRLFNYWDGQRYQDKAL